ncbi:PUCC protein [Chondrocystis sp. NIES-4102]|nr:PUCC protein [Chondrocystis sp. NIES-4102]
MTIELPDNTIYPSPKRQVGLLTIFRLGLFNLGLGLVSVLLLAVLNRVMISELAIPATITGGILATISLVSPARVWFGQLSDHQPILGKHRTNYVLLGVAILGVAIFLAVQVVWQLGEVVRNNGDWIWNSQTIGWSLLLTLIMAICGLATSCSSTPFTALLVDISEEETRSKLVAIVWSMLMVGIVIGGITGSIVFKGIENQGVSAGNIPLEVLQPPINSVFGFVPFVFIALAVIATWGVEKKYSRFNSARGSNREDSVTFTQSLKILTVSRQTGIFFSFLSILTIGLFMQEAVLEPYGGEIFGMSIGETTKLNSYWGIGILLGYAVTGFKIIPAIGKKLTAKMGCILVAVCFGLIIWAGFTQQPQILQGTMVLFGIAAGMATVSSISLMLDLTLAESAGTFIGAWGLAQAMSRGIATFIGGAILDLGKNIFSSSFSAYSLVFAMQAIAMILGVIILDRVSIQEFKASSKNALSSVMQADLD